VASGIELVPGHQRKRTARLRVALPAARARDKGLQLPTGDGQAKVEIQVNIKEKRKVRYTIEKDPPRLVVVDEKIGYSGSDESYAAEIESAYELDGDDKLVYRCRRFVSGKEDPALARHRSNTSGVSREPRWPD